MMQDSPGVRPGCLPSANLGISQVTPAPMAAHSYSCREARLTYRASLVLVCYVNFTDVDVALEDAGEQSRSSANGAGWELQ